MISSVRQRVARLKILENRTIYSYNEENEQIFDNELNLSSKEDWA